MEMPSQHDRLNSYADAVRLVHELRQQAKGSGDSEAGERADQAQYAADMLKGEIDRNRTTPVRKLSWAERLIGISAKPTRAEKKFHKDNGFWKKIF